MPRFLDAKDPGFDMQLAALAQERREMDVDVDADAQAIIAQVRADGDAALISLTKRFDHIDLAQAGIQMTAAEIDAIAGKADPAAVAALTLAAQRITAYHRRQVPSDDLYRDGDGVVLGHRWTPIDAAGLYVPGGKASYPSSVLMNALPAKVAGVRRLAMTVPMRDGSIEPLVIAAARIAGVTEIYRVGGAQAVAALAYGTQTIAPVDKIVGPGNAYVAAAKRRVFGHVGIDTIAGPSEILVISDAMSDPAWIAADLLSQAEHDESSQSVLITTDAKFAAKVADAVEAQLRTLPKQGIARAAWERWGILITVADLAAAARVANLFASEHLELAVEDPDSLLPLIRHAGAIFLGRYAPEAIGDYVAGPNHVLPTSRTARFSSGLGVLDFMKRSSIIGLDAGALAKIGPAAMTLAQSEDLAAHGRSIGIRLNQR